MRLWWTLLSVIGENDPVGLLATWHNFASFQPKQSTILRWLTVQAPYWKSKSKLPSKSWPQPVTRNIWCLLKPPPNMYISLLNTNEHEKLSKVNLSSVLEGNENVKLVKPPLISIKLACLLLSNEPILIAKTCVPETARWSRLMIFLFGWLVIYYLWALSDSLREKLYPWSCQSDWSSSPKVLTF